MSRMTAGRAVVTAALTVMVLAPWGVAASAAEVSGPCSGSAASVATGGTVVDTVRGPGQGGTESSPFRIDPNGSVAWKAATTADMRTGTWSVTLGGVPVRSGDIDNPDGKKASEGVQRMDALPAFVAQVLTTGAKVKGEATATSGGTTCQATVWISGIGNTTGSAAFWVGTSIVVLSLVLLGLMFGLTTATTVAAPAGGATLAGTGVSGS